MKNMSPGIGFSEIFGFHGHFFVSFCVSGRLSTCSVSWGRLGARNKVAVACSWSPLGSISAPFFEQNRIIFMLFFDCFPG